jgi:hypothetical protein
LDNPSSEPSTAPLDTNSAAEMFASLLSPEPEKEQQIDTELAITEPEVSGQGESTEDEQTVTVKIDGKDVEVKLSELKNGYQRQSDYTKKTMEAAETRKAAEAVQSQAQQERQSYALNLQKMQAQLEGALNEQSRIDWNSLIETDPVEYLKQQHLAQQRQAAYQQNITQQQQLQAQLQAEQTDRMTRYLIEQQQELLAKLPDWKDEAKAKAEKTALKEYIVTQGFDAQSVNNISDAKVVLMARKAMLYDQMISKAQVAAKKVSQLPQRVERSGTGEANMDKRSASFQRLTKSGRIEDAASVFSSFI